MKFSEKWLREWVSPALSTDALTEQLTMAGLEVEGVEDCRPDFSGIIVARVDSVEKHPQAERLSVCRVDAGEIGGFTVVCGADNVKAGSYFALAQVGAVLPGGHEIKAAELKGIQSEGMLCSSAELGLSDEAEFLLELGTDSVTGMDLQELLELDDCAIELSLTPNRGDCLSITGIAREVGVLNDMAVNTLSVKPVDTVTDHVRGISLDAPQACPCYLGRIIDDININRVSPTWLVEKLRRSGVRSINIVVDITNYVMLELGQPMHAFDNDLLQGDICVRLAQPGEKIDLLDGQACELSEQTLVIADESRAVAMAGIMGGLDTAVSENTTSIFLESAFFAPAAIAGRARQYGKRTDSSHRFERGVDYQLQNLALHRATELVLDLCGGKAGPEIKACEPSCLPEQPVLTLRAERIKRVLGIAVDKQRVTQILQQLDMAVTEGEDNWAVTAPTFRFDMALEVDLIEEIARIYGYNKFPSSGLQSTMRIQSCAETSCNVNELSQILVTRGYHEAITYSFVDSKLQEKFYATDTSVPLLNPISSDLGVMRQSLLPGLLAAMQYNLKRQQQRVRLFEYGRVFKQQSELIQDSAFSGIICGNILPEQWDIEDSSSNLYDIKNDMESLLRHIRADADITYREIEHKALHPGQSAEIIYENQVIGLVGSIHPAILRYLDMNQTAFAFELYLSRISPKSAIKFTKISKYPSVRRDISILVDQSVSAEKVMKCIENTASELLENLELFDVYQGEGIDIEKKSLALGLTFQRSSSTLTDEEVENIILRVINDLHSELGTTLRE